MRAPPPPCTNAAPALRVRMRRQLSTAMPGRAAAACMQWRRLTRQPMLGQQPAGAPQGVPERCRACKCGCVRHLRAAPAPQLCWWLCPAGLWCLKRRDDRPARANGPVLQCVTKQWLHTHGIGCPASQFAPQLDRKYRATFADIRQRAVAASAAAAAGAAAASAAAPESKAVCLAHPALRLAAPCPWKPPHLPAQPVA